MKNLKSFFVLPLLFLVCFIFVAKAQSLTKTFDIKDFDKISLDNINGEVNIELGKEFSISITMDNKWFENFKIEKSTENRLKIELIKNKKGNWYAENDVKITITMPEISKLYNNSNANININDFVGRYMGIENNGNGDISLNGKIVDLLDVKNNGNGDVKAKNIEAKEANITKSGNGNVEIKTNQSFKAKLAGNGDVINFGNGEANVIKRSGNGKAINR